MIKTVPGSSIEVWEWSYVNGKRRAEDADKIVVQIESGSASSSYIVEVCTEHQYQDYLNTQIEYPYYPTH